MARVGEGEAAARQDARARRHQPRHQHRRACGRSWKRWPPERGSQAENFPDSFSRRRAMSNHVYKTIELTGSSPKGLEDAVANAVKRAAKTLHNLRWFQVTDTRGEIENGK